MNENVNVGGYTRMTTGQEPTSDDVRKEDESAKRLSMLATLWRMRAEVQTRRDIILSMMLIDYESGYQTELDALMWAIGLCAREEAAHVHSE